MKYSYKNSRLTATDTVGEFVNDGDSVVGAFVGEGVG